MKLTPWLRSLKNGLTRTFTRAKLKRRDVNKGGRLSESGTASEVLEDRVLLAISQYVTQVADGEYAATYTNPDNSNHNGVLLQGPTFPAIDLPGDLNGVPTIKITVRFTPNIDIDVTNGRPFIGFNTYSVNPTATNFTGIPSVANYQGGNQTNVGSLDFYYRILDGQNTPGVLQPNPVLQVLSSDSSNNGAIIVNTGTAVAVSMRTLPTTGFSANGIIIDEFKADQLINQPKNIYIDTKPIVLDIDATTAPVTQPTKVARDWDSLPFGQANALFPGGFRRPYRVGDPPIFITVSYSEPVSVAGTPRLVLNTDSVAGIQGTDTRAVYVSGSGSNRLVFSYTVVPGDNANDLDIASGAPLEVIGSSLKDQDFIADNAFVTAPAAPNGVIPGTLGRNRAIQVDTTSPLVGAPAGSPINTPFVGVTSLDANTFYGVGQTITIRVSFNEAVVLTGTPSLLLKTGPVNREAVFAGLVPGTGFAGSNTLLFRYVVQKGDQSGDGSGVPGAGNLDYADIDSLRLNGGTLTDLAGNPAFLTLPKPNEMGSLSFNRDIVIDTPTSVVNVITTLPNGSYGTGQVIPVQVQFNKAVAVGGSGVPQLILDLDGTPNSFAVNYSSGSGTKILTFNYTIQAGHNAADLDYLSIDALQLNGGTIIDVAANGAADIKLAIPGSVGSLGGNQDIRIDTITPRVSVVSASFSAPDTSAVAPIVPPYVAGQTIPVTITFSEAVSVTGTPQVTLDTNGVPGVQPALTPGLAPDAVVNYSSGSGTSTLTFNYLIAAGQNSADLDALTLTIPVGSGIKDLAGNDIVPATVPASIAVISLPTLAGGGLLTRAAVAPNILAVKQVTSLNIAGTPVSGDTYSFMINGVGTVTSSFVAGTNATPTQIALDLRTKINNSVFPNPIFPVVASGAGGRIDLTAKVAGIPFTVTPSFNSVRVNTAAPPVVAVPGGVAYGFTVSGPVTAVSYPAAASETTASIAAGLRGLVNLTVPQATVQPSVTTDVVLTASDQMNPLTLTAVQTTTVTVGGAAASTAGDQYQFSVSNFATPFTYLSAAGGESFTAIAIALRGVVNGLAASTVTASGTGANIILTPKAAFAGVPFSVVIAGVGGFGVTNATAPGPVVPTGQLIVTAVGLQGTNPAPSVATTISSLYNNLGPTTGTITAPVVTTANVVAGAQIDTVTVNPAVVPGASYEFLLNGVQVSTVAAAAGDTDVLIAARLRTAILGNAALNTAVSVPPSGTGTLTITSANPGTPFTLVVTQALASNRNLVIDTAPIITFITSPDADAVPYNPGQTINIDVTFSEAVSPTPVNPGIGFTPTDTPYLVLETNGIPGPQLHFPAVAGDDGVAILNTTTSPAGVANRTLRFRYIVGTDQLLAVPAAIAGAIQTSVDLDYVLPYTSLTTAQKVNATVLPSPTALQLSGGFIRDADNTATDLNPILPLPSEFGSLGANKDLQVNSAANDPPINFIPGVQTILEDASPGLVFSAVNGNGITVRDVDAAAVPIQVTLTAGHGKLTLPVTAGLTSVVGQGTSVLTITGAQATINTRLNGLIFKPDLHVNSTTTTGIQLTVLTSDLGNVATPPLAVPIPLTDSDIISITVTPVNDLPVTTSPVVTTGVGTPITISLVATDVDGDALTYSLESLPPDPNNPLLVRTANGTLGPITTSATGTTVVYTPDNTATFNVGQDTFKFFVKDPSTPAADPGVEGTVTINMVPAVALGNFPVLPGFPDITVPEGNFGNTTYKFTVTLNAKPKQPVNIAYTTVDGSAKADLVDPTKGDYQKSSGRIEFAVGQQTADIFVKVNGDIIDEASTGFSIKLSDPNDPLKPMNAILEDNQADITIENDDGVSIDNVSLSEGNAGTKEFKFNVTLSTPQTSTVTVDYKTTDGTASKASDYAALQGRVTFAPNETSKTVTVLVNGDTLSEAAEIFYVDLSSPTGGPSLGKSRGVGTILDDDEKPLYSIQDARASEGNFGSKKLTFTVNLSEVSGQAVTVNYATADLTGSGANATAGVDYIAKTGTVTFQPGVTSQTIDVLMTGDQTIENDEDFVVNLSAGVNANPDVKIQAQGTIANDDGVAALDVIQNEGNSANFMTFNVTVPQSSQNITVNYSTSAGTAAAGIDYTNKSGSLTFSGGVTSQQIQIQILGDFDPEANETFFVNLSYPAGASSSLPPIATPQIMGTIKNDDNVPTVVAQLTTVTVAEGDAGTKNAVFNLKLVDSTGKDFTGLGVPLTVEYTTFDGTATSGITNPDYQVSSSTVTFPINSNTAQISIPVIGDVVNEATETFTVHLSNPSLGDIGTADLTANITDNDPLPTLSVKPLTVIESQAGQNTAKVTVSLFDAKGLPTTSGRTVTVNFQTQDGTALSGADPTGNGGGNDYVFNSGSLTFLPGDTSKTIDILINGDILNENNETFIVSLTGLSNANGGATQGVVTIKNDDGEPSVQILDRSVPEGDAGKSIAEFDVILLNTSTLPVTVSYSTSNGTATVANNDYEAAAGTVTFQPGDTKKTISVSVIGDLNEEKDETFQVTLSNPKNATISDGTAFGTILTDDIPATLSVADAELAEGGGGGAGKTMNFTVTRSGSTGQSSSVQFFTSNGIATAGLDFTSTSGTLTFNPGESSRTISVPITGDDAAEPDETFFINLTGATNASISVGKAMGTILNDDSSVPVVTAPTATLSAKEETNLPISGISVVDPNAGSSLFNVVLSVGHGTVTVRTDAVNGVTGVSNNGTASVSLEGTITAINATLASPNGVVYLGGTDYSGDELLTVTAINQSGKQDAKGVKISVANVNDAPVITFTQATPASSVGGKLATPFADPSKLTLEDKDNLSFKGGLLTVKFSDVINSSDKISIMKDGGSITFKSKKVFFNGQEIGKLTKKGTGKNGNPLEIQLNGNASVDATLALMNNITFSTSKAGAENTTSRFLQMTLNDAGVGGLSEPVSAEVLVSPNPK